MHFLQLRKMYKGATHKLDGTLITVVDRLKFLDIIFDKELNFNLTFYI